MTEKAPQDDTGNELQHQVEVQWAVEVEPWMPKNSDIHLWSSEVLRKLNESPSPTEVCVRIVSEAEIQGLNRDYRDIDKTTNVLAFPQSIGLDVGTTLLGDIVICAPVVLFEATSQAKAPRAHFAHLIVHGMLHLLGYDHLEDKQAEEMERTEIVILRGIGVDDPYRQD